MEHSREVIKEFSKCLGNFGETLDQIENGEYFGSQEDQDDPYEAIQLEYTKFGEALGELWEEYFGKHLKVAAGSAEAEEPLTDAKDDVKAQAPTPGRERT